MITVVQGGQYGSEAKGAVTGYLALNEKYDICVRTGAVNAGHTVYYRGKPYKMQQLPVGWVNPSTVLVIGAGAMVYLDILQSEIELVEQATGRAVTSRLLVDHRAGVHTADHTERSTASGRHHRIGATGKGSSEAIIDKIRGRGNGYRNFGRLSQDKWKYHVQVVDTAQYLNRSHDEDKKILLEGTQGTLLDLNLGPYPYTTHKMTSPANWLAEAGLSPTICDDVVMVVRTFPIRVAGNSGFMPGETSWPAVAREVNEKLREHGEEPRVQESAILAFEESVRSAGARAQMLWDRGDAVVERAFPLPRNSDGLDQHRWEDRFKYQVALSELNKIALESLSDWQRAELSKLFEYTTVTKKLRRVARISMTELSYAAMLVRPSRVVITFMNYEFPHRWGSTGHSLSDDEMRYIEGIETACQAPVTHVSYGPGSEHMLRV